MTAALRHARLKGVIRRLAATIFAALTLQLNVVNASAPCDMNTVSHGSAEATHHDVMDHESAHPTTPEIPSPHNTDCDHGSMCCVASTCSAAIFSAAIIETLDNSPAARSLRLTSRAPLSRITTPDPPPPRT